MNKKIYVRTYGRRKCRNFNKDLMKDNYFLIQNELEIKNKIFKILLESSIKTLEIGFGNGEVLIHRSQQINKIHIGVDVYENGTNKVLKYIKDNNKNNILLFLLDVRIFLKHLLDLKFQEIYILFPDPWHKKSFKKRQKHRLINKENLEEILKFLEINGDLYFATDNFEYYSFVKNLLPNFMKIEKETINSYINDNFILSTYEKKATEDKYYFLAKKIF